MATTGERKPTTRAPEPGPGGAHKAGPKAPRLPRGRIWWWFLLILILNYSLGRMLFPGPAAPATVPYTLFKQEVAKSNVHAIFSRGETITGRFWAPVTYPTAAALPESTSGRATPSRAAKEQPRQVTSFTTTLPSFVDPGLEAFLIEHGVEISAKPIQEQRSPLTTILLNFGPGLVFILFYIWLFRRSGQGAGGLMGIGKSQARRYDKEQDQRVT